jgi:hypothetical protein
MNKHRFTLFLSGADLLTDEAQDALYESGCDDAMFGERDGAQHASFDREARSFGSALRSALRDVRRAVPETRLVRVEPDELVSMATIARRSGLSREYIRLLANGERGAGGFPSPVAYADKRTRLWHWPDVARWLVDNGKAKIEVDAEAADLVAALNAALDVREHAAQLPQRERELVAEALGPEILALS